jgi:hypothetical protein
VKIVVEVKIYHTKINDPNQINDSNQINDPNQ